jgi:hypothetical protein
LSINEYTRQNLGIQINNQYEAIFIYGLKLEGKALSKIMALGLSILPSPMKKHPKVVYRILVARGGIEAPTQGFSIPTFSKSG